MPFTFTVSDVIPAAAEKIYDAWLDSAGHTKMTGGKKANINADPGGEFTAWNGYITGRNLMMERPRRIVQTWRTSRFIETDLDSQIEVTLAPAHGGTRVTIKHSNVPDGHTSYRDGGWQHNYFDPMKKYFGEPDSAAPKA